VNYLCSACIVLAHFCLPQVSLFSMERVRNNNRISLVSQLKFRPSNRMLCEYFDSKNEEEFMLTRKIAQILSERFNRIREPRKTCAKWRLFWATLVEDVRHNYSRLPSWVNIEKIFTDKEVLGLCTTNQSIELGGFIEESLLEIAQLLTKEDLAWQNFPG